MSTTVVTVEKTKTVSITKNEPEITTVVARSTVATVTPDEPTVSEIERAPGEVDVVFAGQLGPRGPQGVPGEGGGFGVPVLIPAGEKVTIPEGFQASFGSDIEIEAGGQLEVLGVLNDDTFVLSTLQTVRDVWSGDADADPARSSWYFELHNLAVMEFRFNASKYDYAPGQWWDVHNGGPGTVEILQDAADTSGATFTFVQPRNGSTILDQGNTVRVRVFRVWGDEITIHIEGETRAIF